jgi:heme exporter protein CcmD
MIDLGPHGAFVLAAYAATFLVLGAAAVWIVADDLRQRRAVRGLQARGATRRSEARR